MINNTRPIDIFEAQCAIANQPEAEHGPDINPVEFHLAVLCVAAAINDIGWKTLDGEEGLVTVHLSDGSKFEGLGWPLPEDLNTKVNLTGNTKLVGGLCVNESFFRPNTILHKNIGLSLAGIRERHSNEIVIERSRVEIEYKPNQYGFSEQAFGLEAEHSARSEDEPRIRLVSRTPFPAAFRSFTDPITDPVTGRVGIEATAGDCFTFLETLGVPTETMTKARVSFSTCLPYATPEITKR